MGSQDGRVYEWDFKLGQMVGQSSAQSGYVDALAVTRTGLVAYSGFGKVLRLWNPETGTTRSFPAAVPSSNLIVDADGTSVIVGTAGGTVEVWDTATGHRTKSIAIPRSKHD